MILDDIIDHKRGEVADAKKRVPVERLRDGLAPRESGRFFDAIGGPENLSIIAEVKKASPSKGVFREDFDPAEIARAYAEGGASAISVLTDGKYFQGEAAHLVSARDASGLPALRKDFIIDEYQIWETAAMGADAMLLIVAVLSRKQLSDYIALASQAGLDVLVEVHDEPQLEIALEAGARIIGINNRDLRTFKTDIGVTLRLAGGIPEDCVIVSESGIHTGDDARHVREAGADAVLVGEALMLSGDVAAKIRELQCA